MRERRRRIGMNEAVFREVNERIEGLADTFQLGDQPLDLVCECGDATCMQRISMSRADYEGIRSDPHVFAVFPGHEAPDIEKIMARRRGYDVVEKLEGKPARIAESTDPRKD